MLRPRSSVTTLKKGYSQLDAEIWLDGLVGWIEAHGKYGTQYWELIRKNLADIHEKCLKADELKRHEIEPPKVIPGIANDPIMRYIENIVRNEIATKVPAGIQKDRTVNKRLEVQYMLWRIRLAVEHDDNVTYRKRVEKAAMFPNPCSRIENAIKALEDWKTNLDILVKKDLDQEQMGNAIMAIISNVAPYMKNHEQWRSQLPTVLPDALVLYYHVYAWLKKHSSNPEGSERNKSGKFCAWYKTMGICLSGDKCQDIHQDEYDPGYEWLAEYDAQYEHDLRAGVTPPMDRHIAGGKPGIYPPLRDKGRSKGKGKKGSKGFGKGSSKGFGKGKGRGKYGGGYSKGYAKGNRTIASPGFAPPPTSAHVAAAQYDEGWWDQYNNWHPSEDVAEEDPEYYPEMWYNDDYYNQWNNWNGPGDYQHQDQYGPSGNGGDPQQGQQQQALPEPEPTTPGQPEPKVEEVEPQQQVRTFKIQGGSSIAPHKLECFHALGPKVNFDPVDHDEDEFFESREDDIHDFFECIEESEDNFFESVEDDLHEFSECFGGDDSHERFDYTEDFNASPHDDDNDDEARKYTEKELNKALRKISYDPKLTPKKKQPKRCGYHDHGNHHGHKSHRNPPKQDSDKSSKKDEGEPSLGNYMPKAMRNFWNYDHGATQGQRAYVGRPSVRRILMLILWCATFVFCAGFENCSWGDYSPAMRLQKQLFQDARRIARSRMYTERRHHERMLFEQQCMMSEDPYYNGNNDILASLDRNERFVDTTKDLWLPGMLTNDTMSTEDFHDAIEGHYVSDAQVAINPLHGHLSVQNGNFTIQLRGSLQMPKFPGGEVPWTSNDTVRFRLYPLYEVETDNNAPIATFNGVEVVPNRRPSEIIWDSGATNHGFIKRHATLWGKTWNINPVPVGTAAGVEHIKLACSIKLPLVNKIDLDIDRCLVLPGGNLSLLSEHLFNRQGADIWKPHDGMFLMKFKGVVIESVLHTDLLWYCLVDSARNINDVRIKKNPK